MKPNDLHPDQILTDDSGTLWRTTAVNLKCDKPHFLADMLEPGHINGATLVCGNFPLSTLHRFELCLTAV